MIDLEKLRKQAQDANTAEQWYSAHDMTSCSYDYDKAFIAECSPSVVLELLDHIAALEKDAGRLDWLLTEAKSRLADVLENDNGQAWKEGRKFLEKSDTAMESKHG